MLEINSFHLLNYLVTRMYQSFIYSTQPSSAQATHSQENHFIFSLHSTVTTKRTPSYSSYDHVRVSLLRFSPALDILVSVAYVV